MPPATVVPADAGSLRCRRTPAMLRVVSSSSSLRRVRGRGVPFLTPARSPAANPSRRLRRCGLGRSERFVALAAAIEDLTFNLGGRRCIRGLYGYAFEKPSAVQQHAVLPIVTGTGLVRHHLYLCDLPIRLPDRP